MNIEVECDIEGFGKRLFTEVQKFPLDRQIAVEDYMFKEAGVHPISNEPCLYLTPKEQLKLDELDEGSTGGFFLVGKVIEEGQKSFEGNVVLIGQDPSPVKINSRLVHELLGHVGFHKHIAKADDHVPSGDVASYCRLTEVFSRLIKIFADGKLKLNLEDCRIAEESGGYRQGTSEVLMNAIGFYGISGKRAITSLFYEPGREGGRIESLSLLEIFLSDVSRESLEAISIISAAKGGEHAISLFRDSKEKLMNESEKINSRLSFDTSYRAEVGVRRLEKEFGLGETFSAMYIQDRNLSPRDLTTHWNGVPFDDLELFGDIYSYKWSYAHTATELPSHERGEMLLNHFIKDLESFKDLSTNEKHPLFIHKNLGAYKRYLGTGDNMAHRFVKYDFSLDDVSGLLLGMRAPLVVAKRGVVYPFKRAISHFKK